VTVHLSPGSPRNTAERHDALVHGAAMMLTFGERGLVFAELAGDDRSGAIRSADARWWLVGDRLDIDFSIARLAGMADSALHTIGLTDSGFGAFD